MGQRAREHRTCTNIVPPFIVCASRRRRILDWNRLEITVGPGTEKQGGNERCEREEENNMPVVCHCNYNRLGVFTDGEVQVSKLAGS